MKTREHKIASIAKRLAQNGWSSIYSYVEKHFDEDDYDDTSYGVGDEVHWEDPDEGKSSGTYKLIKQITDDGYESVWLISNGTSEAEVYEYELS